MATDEAMKSFLEWRERQTRTAWIPVVRDGEGVLTDSKFSGTPWLREAEAWPTCRECRAPLQLFLQLNLSNLPNPISQSCGTGLLQFFNCSEWDCGPTLGDWEAFSDATVVRVVHPDREQGKPTVAIPNEQFPNGRFPGKVIVDWVPERDYPHLEDWGGLGLESRFAEPYTHWRLTWKKNRTELGIFPCEEFKPYTQSLEGDKLGGWPYWVQASYLPNCKICNRQMQYLFQMDSEKNLPHMFGDCGVGRISQCPNHKDVVAFTYECC